MKMIFNMHAVITQKNELELMLIELKREIDEKKKELVRLIERKSEVQKELDKIQ